MFTDEDWDDAEREEHSHMLIYGELGCPWCPCAVCQEMDWDNDFMMEEMDCAGREPDDYPGFKG